MFEGDLPRACAGARLGADFTCRTDAVEARRQVRDLKGKITAKDKTLQLFTRGC